MDDDGDVDIYSDVGEFCAENKHDAKDLLSAASADLDLLDTSVLPRQETPVKTNDRPPLIAKKPEVSVPDDLPTAKGSVARGSSANTRNTASNVGKAIAALKKENGILRHNISVLYLTAKHLVDSKDKEIAGLKRRLDNVVFKRNQGAQDYPFNTSEARGVPRRRSRSPRDHPPGPSGAAQSCQEAQPQKRHHSPERPVATTPKVDMSEDLQRLYEYNNVRPRHRTEFSKVPLLALPPCKKEITSSGEMVACPAEPGKLRHRAGLGNRVPMLALTPRKKEIASSSGMASPTKSAAQRNARRLVKNSIKNVVSSPTKRPRRLEVHRTVPFKGRRLADRAQVPLKKQPMESSACQPNKGVSKQQNKMAMPRRPLESQETSGERNKPLGKAPPSENSISVHKSSPIGSKCILRPSVEERSPLRFSPGRNSKLGTHSLKGLVDSHHIPAKRRRSRSRSFSRSPSPRPCSPTHYPPHSRKSLHDRLDFNHASRRSPTLRHRSPVRQYSSPGARGPRPKSQERRSPVPHRHFRLERSMHSPSPPPQLSTTSSRQLSPGQRPRSPYYEDEGFRCLSSPPQHSRASHRQVSLGRKPRSPYREDRGLGQLPSPPRFLSTSQRLVSPGRRPKSPYHEGEGLGQSPSPPQPLRTSQRRDSPGRRPRSPHCEDKGSLQPGSPPRIAGTSRRQRSPRRRPRSPCDGDVGLVHSASPPRLLGTSGRQHSPGRRPRSPYDGDVGLAHSASPPRLLGTSRRQHSPGRRPRSPYDGDMGLAHSASPPRLLGTSRRQHSPGRRPRSPYDGDKGLGHSRMPRKQLSPTRRPRSPCGVDKGLGHCTKGKTLARKPTKTAPAVALSSVVVVGNAMEQANGVGASKPLKGSGRVLEEGELSDSD